MSQPLNEGNTEDHMATAAQPQADAGEPTPPARGQVRAMQDLISQATDARKEYERAANIYAGLAFVESKLEAERHGVKHEAIKRLMAGDVLPFDQAGKPQIPKPGLSASAAEKIVETDETYSAHLKLQRETVRDKNNAHTRMESARMRVQITLAAVRALGGF